MLKINSKKIIYFHLVIDMIARLARTAVPVLEVLGYIPDILNVLLLLFAVSKCFKRGDSKLQGVLYFIVLLLIFDTVTFFLRGEGIILFLWGIRNQYRFLIFFFVCCVLFEKEDIPQIFLFLYRWFLFNLFVVTIEFLLGYRRDYLGGTFGLDNNCTGVSNVFLCIMIAYATFGWCYKTLPFKKVVIVFIGSMYWAALAEIKVLFLEVALIIVVLLIEKGKTIKKTYILVGSALALFVGITLLKRIYPDQAHVFSISGMINYLRYTNVGIHGFGRLSAIPISNGVFFNNNIWLKLFGIGVGNGEMADIGSVLVQSQFYQKYSAYAYTGYFYAMIYVERGLLGLIWYAGLFAKSIKVAYGINKSNLVDRFYRSMLISAIICFTILTVYDASIRISTSGYLVFMILAMPFSISKNEYIKKGIYNDSQSDSLLLVWRKSITHTGN